MPVSTNADHVPAPTELTDADLEAVVGGMGGKGGGGGGNPAPDADAEKKARRKAYRRGFRRGQRTQPIMLVRPA